MAAQPKPKPEPPVKDQPEPLSGPDFLDAVADSNAASGLDVNAAEFRRRAQQWRADQKRLADLEQTATAGQATLNDLRQRINQVMTPTQRMTG
jgi:hypothetical protein